MESRTPQTLRATAPTEISTLSPTLEGPAACTVSGVVTIVWPYSVVHHTFAFLLATPDARKRRDRGVVRVQLEGSAAKAVAELNLGGGDDLVLSLDGVRWGSRPATAAMPGVIEHQLVFSAKVALLANIGDDKLERFVCIDAAPEESSVPQFESPIPLPTDLELSFRTTQTPTRNSLQHHSNTNSRSHSPDTISTKRTRDNVDEFASPAFIKRARVSYGALFEGGLDLWDEEDEILERATKKKDKANRRRSNFNRPSSGWRYQSKSPSPERESEPKEPASDDIEHDEEPGAESAAPQKQSSTDPSPPPEDPLLTIPEATQASESVTATEPNTQSTSLPATQSPPETDNGHKSPSPLVPLLNPEAESSGLATSRESSVVTRIADAKSTRKPLEDISAAPNLSTLAFMAQEALPNSACPAPGPLTFELLSCKDTSATELFDHSHPTESFDSIPVSSSLFNTDPSSLPVIDVTDSHYSTLPATQELSIYHDPVDSVLVQEPLATTELVTAYPETSLLEVAPLPTTDSWGAPLYTSEFGTTTVYPEVGQSSFYQPPPVDPSFKEVPLETSGEIATSHEQLSLEPQNTRSLVMLSDQGDQGDQGKDRPETYGDATTSQVSQETSPETRQSHDIADTSMAEPTSDCPIDTSDNESESTSAVEEEGSPEDVSGEDYDIRNYADVQDDEDGVGSEVEEEERIAAEMDDPDTQVADEDELSGRPCYDEDEDDDEGDEGYEDDDVQSKVEENEDTRENDSDSDEANQGASAHAREPSQPVVIDLLSDSDDDDSDFVPATNTKATNSNPVGTPSPVGSETRTTPKYMAVKTSHAEPQEEGEEDTEEDSEDGGENEEDGDKSETCSVNNVKALLREHDDSIESERGDSDLESEDEAESTSEHDSDVDRDDQQEEDDGVGYDQSEADQVSNAASSPMISTPEASPAKQTEVSPLVQSSLMETTPKSGRPGAEDLSANESKEGTITETAAPDFLVNDDQSEAASSPFVEDVSDAEAEVTENHVDSVNDTEEANSETELSNDTSNQAGLESVSQSGPAQNAPAAVVDSTLTESNDIVAEPAESNAPEATAGTTNVNTESQSTSAEEAPSTLDTAPVESVPSVNPSSPFAMVVEETEQVSVMVSQEEDMIVVDAAATVERRLNVAGESPMRITSSVEANISEDVEIADNKGADNAKEDDSKSIASAITDQEVEMQLHEDYEMSHVFGLAEGGDNGHNDNSGSSGITEDDGDVHMGNDESEVEVHHGPEQAGINPEDVMADDDLMSTTQTPLAIDDMIMEIDHAQQADDDVEMMSTHGDDGTHLDGDLAMSLQVPTPNAVSITSAEYTDFDEMAVSPMPVQVNEREGAVQPMDGVIETSSSSASACEPTAMETQEHSVPGREGESDASIIGVEEVHDEERLPDFHDAPEEEESGSSGSAPEPKSPRTEHMLEHDPCHQHHEGHDHSHIEIPQDSTPLITVNSLRSHCRDLEAEEKAEQEAEESQKSQEGELEVEEVGEEEAEEDEAEEEEEYTRTSDHSLDDDPSVMMVRGTSPLAATPGRSSPAPNSPQANSPQPVTPGTNRTTRSKAKSLSVSPDLANDESILMARNTLQPTAASELVHSTPLTRSSKRRQDAASKKAMSAEPNPATPTNACEKPPEAPEEKPDIPLPQLKAKINKSLREMKHFTTVKVLRSCLNKTVDVAAMVVATPAEPQRPRHGPRDFILSFQITDLSTFPLHVAVVKILRPHRDALPVLKAGDVVLLRRFTVASMTGCGFGLRSDAASAWAVFEQGCADATAPQIKGPAIDIEEKEQVLVDDVRSWVEKVRADEKAWSMLEKKSKSAETGR
ncbi:hypothetical protein BROUX41_002154 [Berkeleyomyces rouxiae]